MEVSMESFSGVAGVHFQALSVEGWWRRGFAHRVLDYRGIASECEDEVYLFARCRGDVPACNTLPDGFTFLNFEPGRGLFDST